MQFDSKKMPEIREFVSLIEQSSIGCDLKTLTALKDNSLILYSFHSKKLPEAEDELNR